MSSIPELTPELLATLPLPRHGGGDDKEDRGRVLVIGGSAEMPGALLLAGTAALRAGAGKLQLATVESVAAQVAAAVPEARVFRLPETAAGGIDPKAADRLAELAQEAGAVVLGPGMLDPDAVEALTAALLDVEGPPMLLDAAALKGLPRQAAALARRGGRVVITPHAGEMASCLGMDIAAVKAGPLEVARRAAALLHAVVALKGDRTHIAAPDDRAWFNDHGNVGLATSGSGDVLAGIIAGLMARGAEPAAACLWGVYIHADAGVRLAGRIGPLGYLARELADEIPHILAELDR